MNELVLNDTVIKTNKNGLVCLTDIFKLSGENKHHSPGKWLSYPSAKKFIKKVSERVFLSEDKVVISRGSSGTYAHPQVALAYAKYLSDDLHFQVNEIFIRYKLCDMTLLAEMYDNASEENKEWAIERIKNIDIRSNLTDTYKEHGVNGFGYANCTNECYKGLFGKTAKQLRRDKQLLQKTNLRNSMDKYELNAISFAEFGTQVKIKREDMYGNRECANATAIASTKVRKLLETI